MSSQTHGQSIIQPDLVPHPPPVACFPRRISSGSPDKVSQKTRCKRHDMDLPTGFDHPQSLDAHRPYQHSPPMSPESQTFNTYFPPTRDAPPTSFQPLACTHGRRRSSEVGGMSKRRTGIQGELHVRELGFRGSAHQYLNRSPQGHSQPVVPST